MKWDRLLLAVSVTCGAIYLITQPWQPYSGSFAIKGCSVASLALLAFPVSRILALALTFSATGDVLLDLDPGFFVYGLGCFLLAHLTYIVLFLRSWHSAIKRRQVALAGLIVLYSSALFAWLASSLGSFTVPVVFYVCALTTMVVTSILAGFSRSWVVLGAILFLISDSLIAVTKFKTPIAGRDFLVWSTYYVGQCGIALGYLYERGR